MAKTASEQESLLTFGGHLEVLRKMLFRILAVWMVLMVVVFCFKDQVWAMLLAPSEWNFVTYRGMEVLAHWVGFCDFHFEPYHVDLIATDLSSQFMAHIKTAALLALLVASPYILFELFRFVAPALYEKERHYSVYLLVIVYLLFIAGVLLNYFLLFPISFRFLGTYSVAERVDSNITIDSYVRSFTSLTFVMGVVFQLPVIAFVLAKLKVIQASFLARYRKHALLIIVIVAAIITPPDIVSQVLVSIPLYGLYEVSIRVAARVEKRRSRRT